MPERAEGVLLLRNGCRVRIPSVLKDNWPPSHSLGQSARGAVEEEGWGRLIWAVVEEC